MKASEARKASDKALFHIILDAISDRTKVGYSYMCLNLCNRDESNILKDLIGLGYSVSKDEKDKQILIIKW